jgi:hypothetical protein
MTDADMADAEEDDDTDTSVHRIQAESQVLEQQRQVIMEQNEELRRTNLEMSRKLEPAAAAAAAAAHEATEQDVYPATRDEVRCPMIIRSPYSVIQPSYNPRHKRRRLSDRVKLPWRGAGVRGREAAFAELPPPPSRSWTLPGRSSRRSTRPSGATGLSSRAMPSATLPSLAVACHRAPAGLRRTPAAASAMCAGLSHATNEAARLSSAQAKDRRGRSHVQPDAEPLSAPPGGQGLFAFVADRLCMGMLCAALADGAGRGQSAARRTSWRTSRTKSPT